MKTIKKTHAHASTETDSHEGKKTMKTTKPTQTHASTTTTTHEGETPMKTEAKTTSAPVAETSNPKATTAAPATPTAYVAACSALLDQFEAAFPTGEAMTALDKKRTAKARKGGERYVPQLIALAKQHGVNIASLPLDGIAGDSAEVQALVPLQKQMDRLNKRVETRVFAAQSSSWSGAAKLYTVLKRLSKDDGEIASGLAPVEQYFNHRHPLVAKQHPKTKKGKEALAAEKAAVTNTAEATVTAPAATGGAETAAPPPTVTAPAANGSAVTNGAAHS